MSKKYGASVKVLSQHISHFFHISCAVTKETMIVGLYYTNTHFDLQILLLLFAAYNIRRGLLQRNSSITIVANTPKFPKTFGVFRPVLPCPGKFHGKIVSFQILHQSCPGPGTSELSPPPFYRSPALVRKK